jgi:hypothetical protein
MRPVLLPMGGAPDGLVHGAKGDEGRGLPAEDGEVVAWTATTRADRPESRGHR